MQKGIQKRTAGHMCVCGVKSRGDLTEGKPVPGVHMQRERRLGLRCQHRKGFHGSQSSLVGLCMLACVRATAITFEFLGRKTDLAPICPS